MILAEAAITSPDSWGLTAANYGVAIAMLGWFMWRDKLDREERERRHSENIAQSKRIEDAFRINTDSLIVGISAMKSIDQSYSELLDKMKAINAKEAV